MLIFWTSFLSYFLRITVELNCNTEHGVHEMFVALPSVGKDYKPVMRQTVTLYPSELISIITLRAWEEL